MQEQEGPKLGAPGAGLDPIQWALAKFVFFPCLVRKRPWSKAIDYFEQETEAIMREFEGIDELIATTKVLVPKMVGIEDSSRYWSATMTVEHLVISGTGMLGVIESLASGTVPARKASIAAVKPKGATPPPVVLEQFQNMSHNFVATTRKIEPNGQLRYLHPWFGPLTDHQWLVLAGSHLSIHRKQIETIKKLL